MVFMKTLPFTVIMVGSFNVSKENTIFDNL